MRKWMLAVAVIIAGCATMGGYQPTVDPYNDPDAARIPSDEAECRELALHASGGTARQAAVGGAVGGLVGAAAGAAIGAASGARALARRSGARPEGSAAGPTRASAPRRSSSTRSRPACATVATTSSTEVPTGGPDMRRHLGSCQHARETAGD